MRIQNGQVFRSDIFQISCSKVMIVAIDNRIYDWQHGRRRDHLFHSSYASPVKRNTICMKLIPVVLTRNDCGSRCRMERAIDSPITAEKIRLTS